jgi:MFS family permease
MLPACEPSTNTGADWRRLFVRVVVMSMNCSGRTDNQGAVHGHNVIQPSPGFFPLQRAHRHRRGFSFHQLCRLHFGVGGALWVLVLGRVIEGLTAGSISALYAYVADMHEPAERGPAFGMLGAAGGLGFMLGPVLGGALAQISLSAPLYGAAGLALMNCTLV